jgi:hypothetical protein
MQGKECGAAAASFISNILLHLLFALCVLVRVAG